MFFCNYYNKKWRSQSLNFRTWRFPWAFYFLRTSFPFIFDFCDEPLNISRVEHRVGKRNQFLYPIFFNFLNFPREYVAQYSELLEMLFISCSEYAIRHLKTKIWRKKKIIKSCYNASSCATQKTIHSFYFLLAHAVFLTLSFTTRPSFNVTTSLESIFSCFHSTIFDATFTTNFYFFHTMTSCNRWKSCQILYHAQRCLK